jgi:hypothetical protein
LISDYILKHSRFIIKKLVYLVYQLTRFIIINLLNRFITKFDFKILDTINYIYIFYKTDNNPMIILKLTSVSIFNNIRKLKRYRTTNTVFINILYYNNN